MQTEVTAIPPTIPESARVQLDLLLGNLKTILGKNLIGVYVHGSLAMGCFNPTRSDIDVLVLVTRGMAVRVKRQLVESLLQQSRASHPIEISFLRQRDLFPWTHPMTYDLHYSEDWRERFQEQLGTGAWQHWNDRRHRPTDADLAAHVTITRQRGIRLFGPPIDQVFPIVPSEHYRSSILEDFAYAQKSVTGNPVYSVLNMCRVYWYFIGGPISSKAEAGVWAGEHLPPGLREVALKALAAYRGAGPEADIERAELEAFAVRVGQMIRGLDEDRSRR